MSYLPTIMLSYKKNVQKRLQQELAELYDEYVDKVYRFVLFRTGSPEVAEDLTADVFLKIWESLLAERSEIKNAKAFVYTVARNRIIDYYRTKKDTASIDHVSDQHIALSSDDVTREIHIELDMKVVELALGRMKEEYREVIILKYIEELSITEIAAIIQKKNGAVRVLLHRALHNLRTVIENNKE